MTLEQAVDRQRAVIVRVVAMARHRSGLPILLTDSRLDNRGLVWSGVSRVGDIPRHGIVGHPILRRHRRFLVVRKPGTTDIEDFDDVLVLWLPGNTRVGDQLSFPTRSGLLVS